MRHELAASPACAPPERAAAPAPVDVTRSSCCVFVLCIWVDRPVGPCCCCDAPATASVYVCCGAGSRTPSSMECPLSTPALRPTVPAAPPSLFLHVKGLLHLRSLAPTLLSPLPSCCRRTYLRQALACAFHNAMSATSCLYRIFSRLVFLFFVLALVDPPCGAPVGSIDPRGGADRGVHVAATALLPPPSIPAVARA